MTIKDIVDYVMHTPENTNPNILKDMLSQMEGSSEIIDGYLYTIEGHFLVINDGNNSSYDIQSIDETTLTQLSQLYNNDQQFILILEDYNDYKQGVIMSPVTPWDEEATVAFIGTYIYPKSNEAISIYISCIGYPYEDDEEVGIQYIWYTSVPLT